MIDIKTVREEAQKEIDAERTTRAKSALKQVLREISQAEQVVAGLKMRQADLEAQIQDGTF